MFLRRFLTVPSEYFLFLSVLCTSETRSLSDSSPINIRTTIGQQSNNKRTTTGVNPVVHRMNLFS